MSSDLPVARPMVSVIIPSRNRPALARIAVETALANIPAGGEVVFADNSDAPVSLPRAVIDDSRLRVVRPERVLSLPDNWERALAESRGRWIMLLGDKDRLVPSAVERLIALAGERYEAVTYLRSRFTQALPPNERDDEAILRRAPGDLARRPAQVRVIPRKSADALAAWFTSTDWRDELPMLYSALVRRDVIERATARTAGRFFLGPCPDVCAGLQIGANSLEYLETNVPGIVIQFPTADQLLWSNGVAMLHRRPLAQQFASEFAVSPLGEMPFTSQSFIMRTILDFRAACPDAVSHLRPPWDVYADRAASEIERSDSPEPKLPAVYAVARASQRDGFRPRALAAVVKVMVRSRTGFIHRPLRRALRSVLPQTVVPGHVGPNGYLSSSHSNLEDALKRLEEDGRGADRAVPGRAAAGKASAPAAVQAAL